MQRFILLQGLLIYSSKANRMKLSNIFLFTTLLLLPGKRISWEYEFLHFSVSASFLLDMCCHVKEVGGVKYRLVKDHTMKPDSTCKDDCVYQKVGPEGGYYCFRHGDLFSECLDTTNTTSFRGQGKSELILA